MTAPVRSAHSEDAIESVGTSARATRLPAAIRQWPAPLHRAYEHGHWPTLVDRANPQKSQTDYLEYRWHTPHRSGRRVRLRSDRYRQARNRRADTANERPVATTHRSAPRRRHTARGRSLSIVRRSAPVARQPLGQRPDRSHVRTPARRLLDRWRRPTPLRRSSDNRCSGTTRHPIHRTLAARSAADDAAIDR